MKIHSEQQIEAARQAQNQNKKVDLNAKNGFDALLGQEVQKADNSAQQVAAPAIGQTLFVNPLLQTEAVTGVQTAASEPTEQVEEMLDKWDAYAEALQKEGGQGLKKAWNMLEDISQSAQNLKGSLGETGQSSDLASLVNELDAMAATEKFKFNRGDYV